MKKEENFPRDKNLIRKATEEQWSYDVIARIFMWKRI